MDNSQRDNQHFLSHISLSCRGRYCVPQKRIAKTSRPHPFFLSWRELWVSTSERCC